jgi:hypothetical protein
MPIQIRGLPGVAWVCQDYDVLKQTQLLNCGSGGIEQYSSRWIDDPKIILVAKRGYA